MRHQIELTSKLMGALDRIKSYANTESFMHLFQISKQRCVEMGIYAGLGFVSGFLIKRYAQYVIMTVVGAIILGVLQEMNLVHITIQWNQIQEYIGFHASTPLQGGLFYWQWARMHMMIILSFLAGFLLGLKIG